MKHYILAEDGRTPLAVDVMVWARWFDDPGKRRVANDVIGGVQVSTVFLGLDHDFTGKGPPVLWETMVFDEEQDCERYASYEDAVAGHQRLVDTVRAKQGAQP